MRVHKVSGTKVCKFCGECFEYKNSRAKYCSVQCGQNVSKRRRVYNIPGRMGELAGASKHRARAKGLPHNIDGEYLLSLWEEQSGKCCITNEPFDLSYCSSLQKGWSKRNAPSLDRIVPELGYVKGNVRLTTYQVNCAKGAYTDEDFFEMCEKALETKSRSY